MSWESSNIYHSSFGTCILFGTCVMLFIDGPFVFTKKICSAFGYLRNDVCVHAWGKAIYIKYKKLMIHFYGDVSSNAII